MPQASSNKQLSQQHQHTHMSLQVFIPSALMKHCQSSERTQPNKASSSSQPPRPTSMTSSLIAKALSRGRETTTTSTTTTTTTTTTTQAAPSVPASANPPPTAAPIQPQAPHDPSRPTRTRVPAVTSKSMTTAPLKDKSRPPRRKYPSNMRQRL